MKWIVRGVRGAFLVALVFALVVSTDYLLGTTRSLPSATIQSARAVIDGDTANHSDSNPNADTPLLGDSPALDVPTDLSPDLVDADQPAARSADSDSSPEDLAAADLLASASPSTSSQLGVAAAKGEYKRTDVAKLAYGSTAAGLGLAKGPETRPTGPTSFTVDQFGAIYVSDNVNGRIQVYSAQGQHERSLKAETEVHDLVAGDAGSLFILGQNGEVVVEEAATGKILQNFAVSPQASEELGTLRMSAGQVVLESPRQVTYPLTAPPAQGSRPLSTQEQVDSQKKGAQTLSQDKYSTSYRDGGHLYRLDDAGKPVQDIALDLSDIATIVFLNEDRAGNVYVQVERVSASEEVSVEVRQFTKQGELAAVVPLDRVDYVPMTRSAIVTEDGVIYQLVATEKGIVLAKWQRS